MTKSTPSSGPDSVKAILRAAHVLLQPPTPLPTGTAELQRRVKESWKAQPHSWDEGLAAVAHGILDYKTTDDAGTRTIGDLVRLRCLDLLLGLQGVLIKEFWPVEARAGYEAKDCT